MVEYNFDIDEIKSQVEKVIRESQRYHTLGLNIDKIIEDWLKAK